MSFFSFLLLSPPLSTLEKGDVALSQINSNQTKMMRMLLYLDDKGELKVDSFY